MQVYKNALYLMDLCPDTVCITGPPFRGHINSTRAAMPLSPRDNLTAATLLVNLALALLSGSTSPDAAREAFYASYSYFNSSIFCSLLDKHSKPKPSKLYRTVMQIPCSNLGDLTAPRLPMDAALITRVLSLLLVQIIAWAESHLAQIKFMNITEPTHASAQEVQHLDEQYATLLEKAFMRKGTNLLFGP